MIEKLHKKEGWEGRLSNLVLLYYELDMVAGENCCFMFISDAYEAICGTSPIAEWRGKFNTNAKGLALYKKNTGQTSFDMVFQWLNEIPSIGYAQRGDMGIWLDEDDREILGIVAPNGRDFLIRCEKYEGLFAIKLNDRVRLWRAE